MVAVKNILVPTDFSDNSSIALRTACGYAKAFESEIHLVYVVPELTGKLKEIMRYDPRQLHHDLEIRCQSYFDEQITKLPDGNVVKITTKVLVGTPYEQILKYQKKMQIDLIVIRAKGESAIEEVLFGGTSLKIIRYAKCSTLVVRKPKYN